MDVRFLGFDTSLFQTLHNILYSGDSDTNKSVHVRDSRAMAATPADFKEYENSYVFVIDMPGLKSADIKAQVEDDNVLLISGERQREVDKGAKYMRMERRMGKFMRKFVLPENANTMDKDKITAVCQNGVLTVTVEKLPPPKKPETIEVNIA